MKPGVVIRLFAILINVSSFAFCQALAAKETSTPSSVGYGLVVESVVRGTQADRLGIQPGDIMLSWNRGEAKGDFDSPFGLAYVSIEQASRGLVTVHGLSGTQNRKWVLGSDTWGIQTRPNMLGTYLSIYQEGMQLAAGGKPLEAANCLRSAVALVKNDGIVWLAPWFLSRAGRLLFHAQQWQPSDEAFEQAIQLSENAGPMVRAELFRQWASSFEYRGELAQAEKYYHASLLESEKLGPESMAVVNTLLLLGAVDLERDDPDQAAVHLTRGLATAKRLGPYSFQIASILEDFGILFEYRGDLEKAEEYYLKALPIEEQYFRDSRQLANTLTNLGTLAHQRGDLNRAETYHRRALNIAEKIEENGPQLADILSNLGECVLEQGNAAKAEQYQKRALAMRKQAETGTLAIALNLGSLGKIARIRRDFTRAEEYYRQAIAAAVKVEAPEPELARLLTGEADLLRDRGDYQKSEEFYRRALAIVEKSYPGSIDHAELLAELAGTLSHQGQLNAAAELYPQALAALESRAAHLGGAEEDRSRYRAWYVRYYQGYMDVLLKQGRQEQALEVLEGSRARTLLEMLSQAHINLRQGADAQTLKRERDLHRSLQAKTEARIRLVASQHSEEQVSRLDHDIEELLMQERDINAQLRWRSPRYAALTEPRQLSTAEIQKLLDENTILLEYSLGEDHSSLWAVTNNSLAVYDLPPKTEIESAARKVRDLLAFKGPNKPHPTEADRAKVGKEYLQASRQLSKILLQPVVQLLGTRRLLIVSDGALHYIPFSALPIPGRSTDSTPLIVEHEIVNLPSASVLAEIRRQRIGRRKLPGMVAVLADPVFDANDTRVGARSPGAPALNTLAMHASDLTRAAKDVGLTRNGRVYLDRLLYTRKEADAVMAVIPPGRGFEALDFDASRATVMSGVLSKYRIVHFATHGLLNNKHPDLSGLVLSLVNKEGKRRHGFLKLQDIYDLKLPADLVVLSGCDTGLGEEINGEGLVGLTRGFMYAGASRVVASLWSVSDSATADLMAQFYRSMEKDGMRPAAALRAAQIHMWAQPQWRSPYYWAGFQIQGEWR